MKSPQPKRSWTMSTTHQISIEAACSLVTRPTVAATRPARKPAMKTQATLLALTLALAAATLASAQTPQFNIIKPSTTGVPGEEVRVMRFDSEGNLWVAARWVFWGECGIAMLSADQLPYEPLIGGGFDTGAWRVWSSVHHPIPSPYIFDMEIAP